jgi:uncharacterized OB-fold protein
VGSQQGGRQTRAGSSDLSPLELDSGEPRLLAGRCTQCDRVTFPPSERCLFCGGALTPERLPSRGTLWTWTTQGFEPKPPYVPDDGEFRPYGVGYVEFAGYLRVEGRLTEASPERLRIGMDMEIVALERPSGVTYAFRPL